MRVEQSASKEREKVLTPVVPDFSEEITHYIPAGFEENAARKMRMAKGKGEMERGGK